MTEISAVVLAAGEGVRLRPLTAHRPKPMIPVVRRPILEHVLDELLEAGIADITIVVGYGHSSVQSHFGPRYRDASLTYVLQSKQFGSGHALLSAEAKTDGPFLVIYGDQIVDQRIIRDVIAGHVETESTATLGVIPHADVGEYGGVITDGPSVLEIVENPRNDHGYLLNAGVYVFKDAIFDAIRETAPRDAEQSLIDGVDRLLENGAEVRAVESAGLWVDATYPWDLLRIADELMRHRLDGDTVDPAATIHERAVVREPVVIAADCEIGPGAVIGPNVCLGENVTVQANAAVERSIVDTDVRIGRNATLVDCVTGRGVHVGEGTTVPGGPGDVRVGNRIHQEKHLGAVLADHVRDEGGVTYAPGSVVGADTRVQAGSTVRGTIPSDTEVRS